MNLQQEPPLSHSNTRTKRITPLSLGLVIFLLTLSLNIAVSHAAPRTWKNKEGKEIQADLIQIDGDKVRLKLSNNRQVFIIPVDSLSTDDQQFLKDHAAAEEKKKRESLLASRKTKWTEDWDKAQKESQETGLPILLFMTGSDWCGYCMRLDATVFQSKTFKRFAGKNLVLMKADFPNGSQSRSVKEQNAQLRSQFPVSGFPTVYLLDKNLKQLGVFGGYGGDSARDYIKKLEDKL